MPMAELIQGFHEFRTELCVQVGQAMLQFGKANRAVVGTQEEFQSVGKVDDIGGKEGCRFIAQSAPRGMVEKNQFRHGFQKGTTGKQGPARPGVPPLH